MNVIKCDFFASSICILGKLFFHSCLNLEAMLRSAGASSRFLTCVFSAVTAAECIAGEDGVAELLGDTVALGHQKGVGHGAGGTRQVQE